MWRIEECFIPGRRPPSKSWSVVVVYDAASDLYLTCQVFPEASHRNARAVVREEICHHGPPCLVIIDELDTARAGHFPRLRDNSAARNRAEKGGDEP
jgi:hypothetical protein